MLMAASKALRWVEWQVTFPAITASLAQRIWLCGGAPSSQGKSQKSSLSGRVEARRTRQVTFTSAIKSFIVNRLIYQASRV